jgi:alpha/beta superfamily hydrolase
VDKRLIDFGKVNSPVGSILEKHGYFLRDDRHLFGAAYVPEGGAEYGVVLCSPFGEEKVRTLRVYVSFARTLALLGLAAFCFDYFGDGDSEGEFEEATFEDRIKDIRAACDFFAEQYGVKRTGILGLRWGATLAALIAEEVLPPFLILWEPVIDTAKYFYDHLRINLASQMLIEGKVVRTRDELVEDLKAGITIPVEGYAISGDFYFDAIENGLKDRSFTTNGKVLIVQISRNTVRIRPELEELRNAFTDAELVAVPKEFEWEKTDLWQPAPPELFERTTGFLDKNGFLRRNI